MITLSGIRKTYGRTVALDELELEVAEGEFFCLLGPSGAGKTTTLKTVAGLEQPDSGTVVLDGEDMRGVEPYDRGVAMCFESYALYPHRSAYDNLASPLRSPRHRLPAAEARQRIGAIAELLGISGLLDGPWAGCPTGSGSASPSAGCWSAPPGPSSSTSRSPTSTPNSVSRCGPN